MLWTIVYATVLLGCEAFKVKKRVDTMAYRYVLLDTSRSSATPPEKRCAQLRVPVRRALKEVPTGRVRLVVWRGGSSKAPEPVPVLDLLSPRMPRTRSASEREAVMAGFVNEVERTCRDRIGDAQDMSPVLRGVQRLSEQLQADLSSLPKNTELHSASRWIFSDLRDGDVAMLARMREFARRGKGLKPKSVKGIPTLALPSTLIEVCGVSELAPGQAQFSHEVVLQAWEPVLQGAIVRPICELDAIAVRGGPR